VPVLTPNPLEPPSATGEFSAAIQGNSQPIGYRISIAILAMAAAVALLYFGRVFFITVIIAVIIAFLLDPLVGMVMKLRLGRGPASFVVCSLAVLVLYLGVLGLVTQIASLSEDLPAYSERITALVEQGAQKLEEFEKSVTVTLLPKRNRPENTTPSGLKRRRGDAAAAAAQAGNNPAATPAVPEVRVRPEPTPFYRIVYDYVSSLYNVLLMGSFVPFLVYFMLAWRDHLRSRFLSLFRGELRTAAGDGWHRMADVARAYVLGNFFLGLLLGVASSIFFASVRLPYWLLIGPLSGFLSLVPYLGVPLAILPPVMAALPVHTEPAMYVFIAGVVSLLHLLALNLVYPKFVGSRVHLNPLVVTLALMFWGTLWGGIGLLLAVPITAGIKAVCDSVASLRPYGKLLGD
jgi:predicted PurR-regulated permease PerM